MPRTREIFETPDGRYLVIDGRLWRRTNPNLDDAERKQLLSDLGRARSAVRQARSSEDDNALKQARSAVHRAKVALGERGPTWWHDAPDLNQSKVENTPYAEWYAAEQAKSP